MNTEISSIQHRIAVYPSALEALTIALPHIAMTPIETIAEQPKGTTTPLGLLITNPGIDPFELHQVVATCDWVTWVQLPMAGVERYSKVIRDFPAITFTSAKGLFREPVAEHALALTLASLKYLKHFSQQDSWSAPRTGKSLFRSRVGILGAGGIVEELIQLLQPFDCEITVARRSPSPVQGAHKTIPFTEFRDASMDFDIVFLASALTPETAQIVDSQFLHAVNSNALLVNISRGGLIDTNALTLALETGELGGFATDVTDPEPLPSTHPLWSMENALITPHTANTAENTWVRLADRINSNCARVAAGFQPEGLIEPTSGY